MTYQINVQLVHSFFQIVVRRLPPRLTKDEFVETVGPLAENDYFNFVAADLSLEPHAFSRFEWKTFFQQSLFWSFIGIVNVCNMSHRVKNYTYLSLYLIQLKYNCCWKYIYSSLCFKMCSLFFRAYINFLNEEEVFTFTNKFDGYVFVDDRGEF